MDWRSLGGLPGGLGICGDGVVMQLLSGSSESWGAGGCVMTHGQKVAMRQWFIDRYIGMFILYSIVPGAPDGVSHSGVRSEHRCYYWDGYIGINTATYPGYQERAAVFQREVYPFSYTAGTLHCQAAFSRWDIVPFHHVLRRYYILPLPSSCLLEVLMVFAENTGLVVGRTLVDPSGWRVPVLVSNFGQETVMV